MPGLLADTSRTPDTSGAFLSRLVSVTSLPKKQLKTVRVREQWSSGAPPLGARKIVPGAIMGEIKRVGTRTP